MEMIPFPRNLLNDAFKDGVFFFIIIIISI